MPYVGIYEFYKEAEKRGASVHRSLFLEGLPDGAVDAILDRMAAPSSPMAMTQIRVLGGQMARVDPSATAFAHRDAQVMWLSITPYEDPASRPAHDAWSQSYMESLLPYATGVYSNFLEEEGDARIAQAYPAETQPTARRREAPLRPDQPVPPQPEHPPGQRSLTPTRPRVDFPLDAGPRVGATVRVWPAPSPSCPISGSVTRPSACATRSCAGSPRTRRSSMSATASRRWTSGPVP